MPQDGSFADAVTNISTIWPHSLRSRHRVGTSAPKWLPTKLMEFRCQIATSTLGSSWGLEKSQLGVYVFVQKFRPRSASGDGHWFRAGLAVGASVHIVLE